MTCVAGHVPDRPIGSRSIPPNHQGRRACRGRVPVKLDSMSFFFPRQPPEILPGQKHNIACELTLPIVKSLPFLRSCYSRQAIQEIDSEARGPDAQAHVAEHLRENQNLSTVARPPARKSRTFASKGIPSFGAPPSGSPLEFTLLWVWPACPFGLHCHFLYTPSFDLRLFYLCRPESGSPWHRTARAPTRLYASFRTCEASPYSDEPAALQSFGPSKGL